MKKYLTTLLVCSILMTGCTKNESQTQGEINAAEIKKSIANTPISNVYVWDTQSNGTLAEGSSILISTDGVANVNNGGVTTTFSLETLKYWELDQAGNSGYVLNLYY